MASSSLTKLVFFACCFLLFTFSDNHVAGQSDKVQLNIYYDSLCSGCQDFIVNDLVVFYEYSDLYAITNVTFVPFGNAELSENQTITCQHGEEECELNKVEACIIRAFPDPISQYSFIRCVENDTTNWESYCFSYGDPDEKPISDCYKSDLSTKLILGYANQTLSLNPKLDFLPWITVNGEPLYTDIGDVVAQVCTAYKGTAPLPAQCNTTALADRKV